MNEIVKEFVELVENNKIVFTTTNFNSWLLDEYHDHFKRLRQSNEEYFLTIVGVDLASSKDYSAEHWVKANPRMEANVRENEHS